MSIIQSYYHNQNGSDHSAQISYHHSKLLFNDPICLQ
ncbi:hypothetical protein J2T13_004689 [Paenibacillus sp. DS2015]